MLVCLGFFSCKVLKHVSDVVVHGFHIRVMSSDVVIHGFHIRVMFVSHVSQSFDVIVNVAKGRF